MQIAEKIRNILTDLSVALAEDPEGLVYQYASEPDPVKMELDLQRCAVDAGNPRDIFIPGMTEQQAFGENQFHEADRNLAANFRCNLCTDRMYAVKRYYIAGKSSVLVLHQNGPFLDGRFRRDQSSKFIIGSQVEDDLFSRMVTAAGKEISDFHFQEYLACHFNPERSLEENWNERGKNCLNHVRDTIADKKISHLILTGPSAVLLLGQKKANDLAKSSGTIDLPLGPGESNIPALVIRSPAALLAIEQKRKNADANQNKAEWEKYMTLEKEIKLAIVKSLKTLFAMLD